jgi:retinol dehydrogenase 12
MSKTLSKGFLNSQLNVKLPIPNHDFTGQTIIVTGGNTGLGLEAIRHFVRLHAAKVIMAVRSKAKGEAAKADVESSMGRTGVIDVYELDLVQYNSVRIFAKQMSKLPRTDAVVQNAGMLAAEFELAEGSESTITTNVISTILLSVLLLPSLRRSAETFGTLPRMSFVSSGSHAFVQFPESTAESILETLNNEKTANMIDR